MTMFAGRDVGFKRTAVCVVDGSGRTLWRGVVDTYPQAIAVALGCWREELGKVGLESGSMSPWLARGLAVLGFPVICMDARRDLAFMAPIEDVARLARMQDIGVYLGLTPKRYQSGETDVGLGISHQGDAMARPYLYEAANVLLTTVRSPSALKRSQARQAALTQASTRGSGAQACRGPRPNLEGWYAFRGGIGRKRERGYRERKEQHQERSSILISPGD